MRCSRKPFYGGRTLEERYRVQFRAVTRGEEESYLEMATRSMDLLRKWTRHCQDMGQVLEMIG